MTFEELCALNVDELERRKIAHEIANQKMDWWKKPAWLAAMIPAIIAAGSLGVTAYSDFSEAKLRVKEYEQRIESLTSDAGVAERELRLRKLIVEEAEFQQTKALKELSLSKASLEITRKERDDFETKVKNLQVDKDRLLDEQEGFYQQGVKFKSERERMAQQRDQIVDELNKIRLERDAVKSERDQIANQLEEIAARNRQDLEAKRAAAEARERAKRAEELRIAAEIRAKEEALKAAAAQVYRPPLTFCAGRRNCIEP